MGKKRQVTWRSLRNLLKRIENCGQEEIGLEKPRIIWKRLNAGDDKTRLKYLDWL
jgi:hypothetical protein